jgi:hypothetical protein
MDRISTNFSFAMTRRDIPHYHELAPKDSRPVQGNTYRWYLDGRYVYTARVLEFRGGCWATVEVIAPAPEYAAHYTPGATMEIKIAHYQFESAPEAGSPHPQ